MKIPGLLERYYQPLYDSVVINPDTITANFFTTAIENGKTFAETNMEKAGCLPHPKCFGISGISVKPSLSADLNQVKKFADGASFQFIIGTKNYLLVPLSLVLDLTSESNSDLTSKSKSRKTTSNLDTKLYNLLIKKINNQPYFSLPQDSVLDLLPLTRFGATIYSSNTNIISEPFSLKTILYGHSLREVY